METPPSAQRAIRDTTPWQLKPATIAFIIFAAFAAGGWAMTVQLGVSGLTEWSKKCDARFDRIENALGVRSTASDRSTDHHDP